MFSFGQAASAPTHPNCDIKLKKLLEMIEIEFRGMLSDSHAFNKKKHPEVKTKLEMAAQWITENKGKEPAQVDEHLTLIVDVFFCIIEEKQIKLYLQVFNIIQRLVMTVPGNTGAAIRQNEFRMSQDCRERLLYFFSVVTQQDQQSKSAVLLDDNLQIKVLQVVMLFLDPNQADAISKKFVNYVLKTCFQLFDGKKTTTAGSGSQSVAQSSQGTMIKSTIQASLGQLMSIMLASFNAMAVNVIGQDLLKTKDSEQKIKIFQIIKDKQDEIQNIQIFQVVEDFLSDLATALFIHEQGELESGSKKTQSNGNQQNPVSTSSIIGGMLGSISNQHVWNFKPSPSTKCALLDLICLIFDQDQHPLIFFPRIVKLFENQIIPTLNNMIRNIEVQQNYDHTVGIRVIKCITLVIDNLCVLPASSDDHTNLNDSQMSQQSEGSASSKSKSQKNIGIQGIEHMINVFSKMADQEHIALKPGKDKEINSQNIQQVFLKLNWRHLSGLEAITIFLQNPAVLSNLVRQDKAKSICSALNIINRNLNQILLLDHRNMQILLSNFSEGISTPFNTYTQTVNPKLKNPQQASLMERNKVSKLILDAAGAADDELLRMFLNPYHFQKLSQECINGLIISLEKYYNNNGDSRSCEGDSKSTSSASDSRRQQMERPETDSGTELIEICQILNEVLYKLHLSIQCNLGSMQDVIDNGQSLEDSDGKPIYSFDSMQSQYLIQQRCLLDSFKRMINISSQNKIHIELRDNFVKSLCSLCFQKEVEMSKHGVASNLGVGVFTITVGNVMAAQTLIDITNQLLQKTTEFAKKKKKKSLEDQELVHEQDLTLWQNIVEAILRMDSTLARQIEERNQKAQKVPPKGSLSNLQSLDVSHLVDFNKIQRKVNNLPGQERKLSAQLSPQGNDDKNLSRMYSTVNVSNVAGRQSLIAEVEAKPKTQNVNDKPLSNIWCFNGPKFQGGKYLSVIEINQNKLQKVNQTIVIPNLQTVPNQSDLKVLQSQLDQVFSNSQYCEKLTLFQLYGSFSRILNELVLNGIQSPNIDSDLNKYSMSIQLIRRLAELSFINIDRLDLIWDQLVAIMDMLLQNQKLSNAKSNKSNVFIKLSIDFNQAVVLSYFAYKRNEQARKFLGFDILGSSQLEQLGGDQMSPYPMELMSPDVGGLMEQPGKAGKILVSDAESDNRKSSIQESSENKLEESPLFNDVGDQVLWSKSNWQSTILQPITTIIQSIDLSNVNEKYLALRSIERIIQLCGQNMKKEGWTVIIQNLEKANEIFNTASVKGKHAQSPEIIKLELQIVFNCFKCLKLIINNYIQQLSQENFIQIINCFQSFAEQDNDNINSNLTAIGMFMNIADYVAKLKREQNVQQVNQQEVKIDVDFIWQQLFTTMQDIGKQHISEIRRSLIQTLENIVMNHGSILSQQVWTSIFQTTLTDILKHSSNMFIHIGNSKYSDIQELVGDTPSHSQRKKMTFDDENVLKALKANDDQSWSETCIQLISSIYRTIQKYIQIGGSIDKDMLAFWTCYHQILCSLIFHTTHREPQLDKTVAIIIIQIFKSIEDFLKPECQAFMANNICQVFEVMETTNQWVLDEINYFAEFVTSTNVNVCRNNSMVLKITPDVLQTLSKLYSLEMMESLTQKDGEYWSIDKVSSILSFTRSLTLGCQQIGRGYIQPGKPYKLLTEEKALFKFIDKFNAFCQRSSGKTQLMYLEFLLSHVSVTDGNVLQESTVKKNLSIFNSILLTGRVNPEILTNVIEVLFNKIKSCMQQRYNWKVCKSIMQLQLSTIQEPESSQAQNLFLYLSNQIMGLSKFFLNPVAFKEQAAQKQPLSLNEDVAADLDMIQTKDFENNSEVAQVTWKLILPLLKEDLLFKIENFEDLERDLVAVQDKQLFHELIQQSQMLDMEVINFVVSTLLPCCTQISQGSNVNVEEELINIVDNGCQNSLVGSTSHAVLKDLVSGKTSSNLSQYCLLNLFQICRFGNQAAKDGQEDEHMRQIKQRISQQTTPILLNRCKDILRKYAQDESRSGSIHLPQSRVHEIVLILKELMALAHSFQGQSYFLLDLMPILTELISSNDREIKEQLKQIFLEISNEVQKLKKQ